MADKLQQAIALIMAGDKRQGGEILDEILRENPDVELAWLWRSGVVEADADRAYCLQQVLALNPGNQIARKGLDLLYAKGVWVEPPAGAVEPVSEEPAVLEELVAPEEPGATEAPETAAAVAADDPALAEYVVSQLAKQVSRQDLIYDLCQRTGLSWPAVEALVQRVAGDRSEEIKGRQRPLLLMVAVITLLGGIYLFFTNVPYLMRVLQDPVALALSVQSILGRVVLVVTGAAMVVGSLLGVWQALSPRTAPELVNLAEEGTGSERFKSVDDVFDVGVYVGSGHGRHRRRRGTRIF